MKCPKCAYENRAKAVECDRCGVIFAKAVAAAERTTASGTIPVPVVSDRGPVRSPVTVPPASARGADRRQQRTLRKLEPLISHLLEEDEVVLGTAYAMSRYGLLEFLTTGWIVAYLKRCVLVFTDRRILQVLTDPGYRARGSWAEILWADIVGFKASTLFGRLDLELRDGTRQRFVGIPRKDAKRLAEMIESRIGTGERSVIGAKTFRCPRCADRLSWRQERCTRCNFEFKSVNRATWLSVLIPGGGYFYTGHPVMGFFDFLIESYLILVVALAFFAPPEEAAVAVGVAMVFAVFLFIEKLVTIYHARHYTSEFIPAGPRGNWKKQIAEPIGVNTGLSAPQLVARASSPPERRLQACGRGERPDPRS